MSVTAIYQAERTNRPEVRAGLPAMKLAQRELESTSLANLGLSIPENDNLDRWTSHPSRCDHKLALVSRRGQLPHRMAGCPEFGSVANYPHLPLTSCVTDLEQVHGPSLSTNNGTPKEGCWAGLCGCG